MQYKPETVDKGRKSLKEITKKLEHKKTAYKPQTIKEQRLENIKYVYHNERLKFELEVSDELYEFFEDMKNKYTEEEIKAFLIFPYLYNQDISFSKVTELLNMSFTDLGKLYKKYYLPTNSDDYKEKFK